LPHHRRYCHHRTTPTFTIPAEAATMTRMTQDDSGLEGKEWWRGEQKCMFLFFLTYYTANKYHPHRPLGSPPLPLTLKMSKNAHCQGSGHCLSATTMLQPQKRAFALIFGVLAIIYPPPPCSQ